MKKLEDFVIFPRKIIRDLRNGNLSRNEFVIYAYIRLSGNPYGIATISFQNIVDDVFRGEIGVNYCNKMLLSLKSKRYIDFPKRQGRRGSFEVELGDWKLPNGNIKTLVRSSDGDVGEPQAEVNPDLDASNQKLIEEKEKVAQAFSFNSSRGLGRSPYNDTHKEKENIVRKFSLKGLRAVEDFMPDNSHEQRCQEIALELGEKHINPMLKNLEKYGMNVIEIAYGRFKEEYPVKQGNIRNKRAYFQGILEIVSKENP